MIHTVYYRSHASLPIGSDLDREIDAILRVARERNGNDDVTGALVFSENKFFQVLEGPPSRVERTLERILRDARHSKHTVLHRVNRFERRFTGWSMAYVGDDPGIIEHCRSLTLTLSDLPVLDKRVSGGVLRQMVDGVR